MMAAANRTKSKSVEAPRVLIGRKQIVGQDAARSQLAQALSSGRLASSWIFHGPEGVGKRTTAMRLARLLLEPTVDSQALERFQPPEDSPTQNLIDAGTHPDLLLLKKEMASESQIPRLREKKQVDIPVDLLREHVIGGIVKQENREFTPAVYLSPSQGSRRIFIIDEAELLNPTGQNALLKTLEEPAPRSVLILLSTNPARLLPTIRSRCQTLAFRPLDEDAMDEWLASEDLEADCDEVAWARTFADGSPGRLLFAIKHDLQSWFQRLASGLEMLAEGRCSPELWQDCAALIDEFAKACEKANRRTSIESAKREGLDVILAIFANDLRTRMLRAAEAGEDSIAQACARAIDHLVDAERRVGRSLNLKMVLADMTAAISESMRSQGAYS